MTLKISNTLSLPLDFVTKTQAILAKKGAGKSYTAQVLVEELLGAEQHVVALDPTGAWWGLRADAKGAGAGYPIAVLGGDHADVPLEATAGEAIARAVVEERFSCVIDTSCFTVGEESRFVAAFLATLYRLNRKAMHLVADEADVFAPQKPFGEEAKTLGAMQNIVRRGRIRGIGCTLITQRPQVLNKDVLSQVDQLITLRMNHPKDLGAIQAWVSVHGDPKLAAKMITSLPDLPIGDAWVWAPADGIFERVTIRRKRTFDSGRTPKAGEHLEPPKVLAAVDIARLGKAIAATVESMRKTDVRVLHAEIADLRRELEAAKKAKAPATPAIDVKAAAFITSRTLDCVKGVSERLADVGRQLGALSEVITGKGDYIVHEAPKAPPPRLPLGTLEERAAALGLAPAKSTKHAPAPAIAARVAPRLPGSQILSSGEEKTLAALIQYPRGLRREQLTVLTGYKRSTRDLIVQQLGRRGYAEKAGTLVRATDAGRAALPDAAPLPTGNRLRDYWLRKLDKGERTVLETLIRIYPKGVSRDELGYQTGYKRSTRDLLLQRLARRELVDQVAGGVRATPALFEGGAS